MVDDGPHKDEVQLQKDIGRSCSNFDYFHTLNEEAALALRTDLKGMILELLKKNNFNYYQGYNDICSVFLIIMGRKLGFRAADIASRYLIKYLFQCPS